MKHSHSKLAALRGPRAPTPKRSIVQFELRPIVQYIPYAPTSFTTNASRASLPPTCSLWFPRLSCITCGTRNSLHPRTSRAPLAPGQRWRRRRATRRRRRARPRPQLSPPPRAARQPRSGRSCGAHSRPRSCVPRTYPLVCRGCRPRRGASGGGGGRCSRSTCGRGDAAGATIGAVRLSWRRLARCGQSTPAALVEADEALPPRQAC